MTSRLGKETSKLIPVDRVAPADSAGSAASCEIAAFWASVPWVCRTNHWAWRGLRKRNGSQQHGTIRFVCEGRDCLMIRWWWRSSSKAAHLSWPGNHQCYLPLTIIHHLGKTLWPRFRERLPSAPGETFGQQQQQPSQAAVQSQQRGAPDTWRCLPTDADEMRSTLSFNRKKGRFRSVVKNDN